MLRLATFTVQLEIGPETRALIERLIGEAALEIELGPETREILDRFVEQDAERKASKPR